VRIRTVEAHWLQAELPAAQQHVSDFGRIRTFDTVLVRVVTECGLTGLGEAKPAVGSAGNGAALATIVREELAPALLGQDPREVNRHWGRMYNGVRAALAARDGRAMPVLGRRGAHMAALAGVDLALWDLAARARGCSVLELVGGGSRTHVKAYASGGWAPADRIGAELGSYVERGFRAVKMRIGGMDGDVRSSVERVRAARAALGDGIDIMVDAHGTLGVAGARQFCAATHELGLRFVEEPVASDDRVGLAEVRAAAMAPVAAGESEASAFDFAELVERRAVDVLQPDLAIAGGLSEGLRIGAIATAHRLQLAPHCWGSALSFEAARTLALACPAGVFVEVPMGGAPFLRELFQPDLTLQDGCLGAPRGHGWGLTLDEDRFAQWARR